MGFRFYYWSCYKTVTGDYQNKQPLNLNIHNGCTPSDLSIEPKYISLKDEIINNTIHSLHINLLKISLLKTDKLMNTLKCKSLRPIFRGEKDDIFYYGIVSYTPCYVLSSCHGEEREISSWKVHNFSLENTTIAPFLRTESIYIYSISSYGPISPLKPRGKKV